MARHGPPTQARSRARRDSLLDAAADLIAEGGLDTVTHRAVSARAGLPATATTYYFDSRDTLVVEALERALSQRIGHIAEVVLGREYRVASTPAELAAVTVEVVMSQPVSEFKKLFELYLQAHRFGELTEAVDRSLRDLEDLSVAWMEHNGFVPDRSVARAGNTLIQGYALQHLGTRPPTAEQQADLTEMLTLVVQGLQRAS